MANCHELFSQFHKSIDLSRSKKASLQQARRAIRKKIRNHFKETVGLKVPKFRQQGSFAIGTVINPLDEDYDIDDGVYLQHLPDDQSKWPDADAIQDPIVKALENHTDQKPEKKKNCVRINYANNYHVDLPAYSESENEILLCTRNETQWVKSDPTAFTQWFRNKLNGHGEQMRRSVQYLKAWVDFQGLQLPSIASTILVTECFVSSSDRDDLSFSQTIQAIENRLQRSFEVKKSVSPYDDVLQKISNLDRQTILKALKEFSDSARLATAKSDTEIADAAKQWQKQLGNRFGIPEQKESPKSQAGPTIIVNPPRQHKDAKLV